MLTTGIATLPAGLKSRFLEGLAPSELEIIRAAATERRFLANSVITNQAHPAEHLFLLTSGRVRQYFISSQGQKVLHFWLTPGEIFGGAAFLSKRCNYVLSTETLKDSSVWVWDRATIRRLAARCPRLLENGLLVASDYLAWYHATYMSLICHTARERLAQLLIYLAGIIGKEIPGGVEFDVTNEELASAANISVYTASRVLSEWQTSRVVVKRRGKIVLRSPERLLLRVI